MPEPLKYAPYEHLFQHIKQSDVRLYESLKKISRVLELTVNDVNDIKNGTVTPSVSVFEKATFGIVETFQVKNDLTLHYDIKAPGDLYDCVINVKNPGDTAMIFDIKVCTDPDPLSGVWSSVLLSPYLTVPGGDDKEYLVKTFDKKSFTLVRPESCGFLRADCLQIGSTIPGDGAQIVLRWKTKT